LAGGCRSPLPLMFPSSLSDLYFPPFSLPYFYFPHDYTYSTWPSWFDYGPQCPLRVKMSLQVKVFSGQIFSSRFAMNVCLFAARSVFFPSARPLLGLSRTRNFFFSLSPTPPLTHTSCSHSPQLPVFLSLALVMLLFSQFPPVAQGSSPN